MPNPKIPVPIMGMIQCICACADHPYQLYVNGHVRHKDLVRSTAGTYKSPTGTKKEPIISAGIRNSGFPLPPFLFDSCADRQGSVLIVVHESLT